MDRELERELLAKAIQRMQSSVEDLQRNSLLLEEIQKILYCLRKLSVRAAEPEVSANERKVLQQEVNLMLEELDKLVANDETKAEDLGEMIFSDGTIFNTPRYNK